MTQTGQKLMNQLQFIMRASRYFLHQNQRPLSGQKRVLAVLKLEDGLTQNYLAEVLALKPGSLAELLKKLEIKGEIRRETDADDKRVKRVYLTAAGKETLAELEELASPNSENDFFAGLTATEQDQFSQYLEKIATGWDTDFRQQTERFLDPTARMEAMMNWRRLRQNDDSPAEMRTCRRKIRNWHHRSCHYDCDNNVARCNPEDYEKMCEYNRDFWHNFWHNEDDEI
ncbi:MarR family transcriptional regulator [Lactobacillus sp. ESL0785]|uniref:MarR family winged helix-turn-helix transcriptional regulator n=1 Tax=Lactobacillus sp. ESL0785 TaxID=2983232 RepID=UPI0023F9E3C8|nr:MarR family transcriptional regulator [Lactobacillus sp. ESL0785]WEV71287.1 MarR family transcriptional regulator [Lactobacillus sp. ESL0785]